MEEQENFSPVKSKTPVLRTFAVLLNRLSNVCMLGLSLLAGVVLIQVLLGSDIGALFDSSANQLTLGLIGGVGVILYVFLGGTALVVLTLSIAYISINKNYTKLVSVYKGKSSMLLNLNGRAKRAVIWSVVALIFGIILFVGNGFIFEFKGLVSYLLLIPICLQVASIVCSIVDLYKGKSQYNKLPEDQKQEVLAQAEELNKNYKKNLRRKSAGRLY